MELDIPLINDLSKTFNNFNINEYFDSEMIQMHNDFINKEIKNYNDEQIYNYIKFINITCLDVKHYKNIIKYINKNNFDYFLKLFINYDIFSELFHLLPYDVALNHPDINNLKEIWLEQNFGKLFIYYEEFKPYLIYKSLYNEYYIINNKVYCDYNINKILLDLKNIYDYEKIDNKYILIIKYIINIISKNIINYIEFTCLLLSYINKSLIICNLKLLSYFLEYTDNYIKSLENVEFLYQYISGVY